MHDRVARCDCATPDCLVPIDGMAKNTSISLGQHYERFIRQQVAGGRYGTASEVVRAGLRLLEEDEAKLAALRSSLEEGERSGFVESYSLEALLEETAPPATERAPRKKRAR